MDHVIEIDIYCGYCDLLQGVGCWEFAIRSPNSLFWFFMNLKSSPFISVNES